MAVDIDECCKMAFWRWEVWVNLGLKMHLNSVFLFLLLGVTERGSGRTHHQVFPFRSEPARLQLS